MLYQISVSPRRNQFIPIIKGRGSKKKLKKLLKKVHGIEESAESNRIEAIPNPEITTHPPLKLDAKPINIESTAPVEPDSSGISNVSAKQNLGKVGKNLLAALREKNRIEEAQRSKEIGVLTQEIVDKIKESYIQKLATTGRDLLRNQFMTTECIAKDENTFECICSMHLQYNSINNLKQDLSDFIFQQLNNPKLKVITTLIESEQPVTNYVRSKSEIFDEYIQQYPLLKALKDELFLTVKGSYEYEPIPQTPSVVIDTLSSSIEENLDELMEEKDE